jgi:hypothetical protein
MGSSVSSALLHFTVDRAAGARNRRTVPSYQTGTRFSQKDTKA